VDPTLQSSKVGKNNLYKIFVLRSLELLADRGYLSFIVPMAVLGDEQSSGVRKTLFSAGTFSETHAFPQKDNPLQRVFRDAKLSSALFVYRKHSFEEISVKDFRSQVHPAQFIEGESPSVILNGDSIKLYDPENMTIVSCSQEDWDVVRSLAGQPGRLGDFVEFSQGEVNQTVAGAKGLLTDRGQGTLVTRGANISLYQLREASQGEDIFLNVKAFMDGKKADTKAFHHRFERIGLQESSPQNNFRRIIACRIPKGRFCNHKINYTTSDNSKIPLELVLFVLNSSFADWYFRLGSTNAAISHYQLTNIPSPCFSQRSDKPDQKCCKDLDTLMNARDFDAVEEKCLALTAGERCSPTVEHFIGALVTFIEREEERRGEIARTARSHMARDSERCQVILDKMMLALLGVGVLKHEYIRQRLKEML
jgi:hypothetical protein